MEATDYTYDWQSDSIIETDLEVIRELKFSMFGAGSFVMQGDIKITVENMGKQSSRLRCREKGSSVYNSKLWMLKQSNLNPDL